MVKEKSTAWLLLSVLGALSLCYVVNLGYLPLWDPDEPYYVESAREMVERGDLITPFFNYEPRLNKPVFFYWLQILSGKLFGFNELSARVPSFIAGIGLLLLIYKIGNLLYDKKTGLASMLIGATSFEIYVLSRQSVTDMCLAFFMTLAIYGYVSVYKAGKDNGKWYYLYIGTALAVITKGPVGLLLPGAVVFFIMLVQRDFSLIKRMHLFKGIIIFLAIASPWYFLVLMQHGFKFFKIFIIDNNLLRYVTPMYKHTGGIFYYIPVLLLGFFPWILFLTVSIMNHFKWMKEKKITLSGKKNPLSFASLLNITWFAVFFVFFSLSGSKLPAYILGLFPALSLATASGLVLNPRKKALNSYILFHYIYMGLVIGSMMLILRYCFFQGWMLIISISICLTVIAVSFNIFKLPLTGGNFSNRTYGTAFLATLFVMIGLLISANLLLFPKISEYFPTKALGYIAEHSHPESPEIIAYRYYEPSMVFYSHKKIVQVEKKEELERLTAKGKPFLTYMTLRHFKELPFNIQNDCRVISYGIRYRDRIRNIPDLLKSSNGGANRELLLIYYSAKKIN
jgi:4-amino-4-deoxy-L-arabinose transferase-like glycosyltransferase